MAGDPIGSDSSLTDLTGGFSAVYQDGTNMGQPAILVPLNGTDVLTELRVVAFGIPAGDGSLRFDQFDYRLDVWRSEDYFSGSAPEFQLDLGAPYNVELATESPSNVVPTLAFGTAGSGGSYAPTYDFHFTLSNLKFTPESTPLIAEPLPADDWVFGFQSWHDTSTGGTLRVAGSRATEGPLPLFNRENAVDRSILGGQDPDNIALYWGIALESLSMPLTPQDGDFNSDGIVDAADFVMWRDGVGGAYSHSECRCWQSTFGASYSPGGLVGEGDFFPAGATSVGSLSVPEPGGLAILLRFGFLLLLCSSAGRRFVANN